MKPIRAERTREVAHDPWSRAESPINQVDAIHVLNDLGALESHRVVRKHAAGCGCFKPTGGCCAVCATTVCVDCFGHCPCGKPVCQRHSTGIVDKTGKPIRLCASCQGDGQRKRVVRGILRAVLAPFVKFED